MSRPLNLARQPFRNERLPTLLLAAGCVVLLGVSVRHVLAARDLLPERTAGVDGELVSLEREMEQLRRAASELSRRRASPAQQKEWAAVRALVDHRTFSWSALFGTLEEVMPPDVRLVSVAPREEDGGITLTLSAVGRTVESGHELLEVLQEREEFTGPFLQGYSVGDDGVTFEFTTGYVPASGGGEGGP